jgi:hypothetical protein
MYISAHKRQQLLSELEQIHAELSVAIHARHVTVDVTSTADIHRTRFCTDCKVFYIGGPLESTRDKVSLDPLRCGEKKR